MENSLFLFCSGNKAIQNIWQEKKVKNPTKKETVNNPKPLFQRGHETIQAKEGNHSLENQTLEPSGKNDSSVPESIPENEEPGIDAEEEEEDDDDDDDHDEEEENGDAAVDRKWKGIFIEEEKDSDDDDDDDDSSDGGNKSEGEGDLSDDLLAEVDLDNILPSRMRRQAVQPGVYIRKDVGNNA
ncbi:uncharacterized protein LOC111317298 [Durio zibethinus]|uniref:Uncharacterized protein LOC111317298 n=1 Tax=Durio zibethinus TaxID=66656 RepID=A0A6P6BEH4_DURZI|nr:uncharacterized protein LOC111317298 [Durio zibethinus]